MQLVKLVPDLKSGNRSEVSSQIEIDYKLYIYKVQRYDLETSSYRLMHPISLCVLQCKSETNLDCPIRKTAISP